MNISELISDMEAARKKHGEHKVAIVGQDSGGVFPNNFVKDPIAVWFDNETGILVVDIDEQRLEEEHKMDSISTVIDTLKGAMEEHGDRRVEIELQDDGGSYCEVGTWGVGVEFEVRPNGETFFTLG